MINEFDEKVYHPGETQWTEGEFTVTRTSQWTAPGCHNGCAILVYSKDGKFHHVEGDPLTAWRGHLCIRCLDMHEAVNHPDRIKYPMKRAREDRGKDKWERISWEEAVQWLKDAMEDTCAMIKELPGGIGPEGFISMAGTGRNTMWQEAMITRAVFGSPNLTSGGLSGESCYQSRMFSSMIKSGDCWVQDAGQMFPDYWRNEQYKIPEVVILWGHEPLSSNGDLVGHWYVDLMRQGTKFIAIDPGMTWLASKSVLHLKPRVGTDLALAMGMANYIIQNDLYDHDFIDNWSYGFDKFAKQVEPWTLEKTAEVTGVPAELIAECARMYAEADPGQISWGVTVDMHVGGMELCMCINDLVAMTGNYDVPGGQIVSRYAYNTSKKYGTGSEFISPELMDRRLGLDKNPILKSGFSPSISSDMAYAQMISQDPYPLHFVWLEGTNPLACCGCDTNRIYDAFKNVKYVVNHDVFMTPSSMALADLVLPAAMSVERQSFRSWWNPLRAITQSTDRYYESMGDDELVWYLGKEFNPTSSTSSRRSTTSSPG